MGSIQSWRKVENAAQTGVISFYTDGYESDLTPSTLPSLSAADIRSVLNGQKLSSSKSKTTPIYRIVNQNLWYVALVSDATTWNPVVGQDYYLQMQGFEDLSYNAKVTAVQKENDTVLAIFEITDPIGPLIYQRTGKAIMSTTFSGLSVTAEAIDMQNGQTGVWLYDVPGGTFVAVDVLSSDGTTALIQPLVENALGIGQRVLIKH